MKVVGARVCELSGYESLGDAPGRNRSASGRAFSTGRRGYLAAIAASGCQTLVPSARFSGNVNPWRPDATGAAVVAKRPHRRWAQVHERRPAHYVRDERRISRRQRVTNHETASAAPIT